MLKEGATMLKRVIIGVATVAATGLLAAPTFASSSGAAIQEPLLANPTFSGFCGYATVGTPTGSYAVIQPSYEGTSTLASTVALKKADPSETYNVFMVQNGDILSCFSPVGSITTNGSGNGTGFFTEDQNVNTTAAWVAVGDVTDDDSLLATPEYVFGAKK
jgi:hypothetical protein